MPKHKKGALLSDEMIERAKDVLHERTSLCVGADTCDSRAVAVEMLEAAFDGVPMSNYGIGHCLNVFDLVICVKSYETSAKAGVYRRESDPEGFEGLPHDIEVSWGFEPVRFIKHVRISKLPPPEQQEDTQ